MEISTRQRLIQNNYYIIYVMVHIGLDQWLQTYGTTKNAILKKIKASSSHKVHSGTY